MHNDDYDDSSVEIIDLPTDEYPVPKATSATPMWRPSRSLRLGGFISIVVMLSLLLVILTGTAAQLQQSISPLIGPLLATPTPIVQVPNEIIYTTASIHISKSSFGILSIDAGPTPEQCPETTPVSATGEIGHFPIWIKGFSGSNAYVPLPSTRIPVTQPWHGWAIPLHLGIKRDFAYPITVSVGNLGNGSDPMFGLGLPRSSTIILSSQLPNIRSNQAISKQPDVWDTTLYVSGSGCYFLDVNWARGHWQMKFEAGQ